MTHPSKRLDDDVHQRTRRGILAVLCETGRADFVFLRTTLDLSDGNLSRNLSRLHERGLVAIEKTDERRGPRTWVTVTRAGRDALNAEIDALRELITRIETRPDGRRLRPRTSRA